MTRALCHRLFQDWENDASIYMDMSLFKPYVYRKEAVDRYFDSRQDPSRVMFAIMLGDRPIGELQLKQIDCGRKECTLSIHMQNESAARFRLSGLVLLAPPPLGLESQNRK